ncbi:hypothetical protein PSPTOT1_1094 [Pseudomonas syringae pv. tomato T1]|nr:hypothetical protein PSPTOT1_1094 [Pseudomonas syringae pv. tomato T1]
MRSQARSAAWLISLKSAIVRSSPRHTSDLVGIVRPGNPNYLVQKSASSPVFALPDLRTPTFCTEPKYGYKMT